jgi:formate-dependent nitrite reductase membrane component NrfD
MRNYNQKSTKVMQQTAMLIGIFMLLVILALAYAFLFTNFYIENLPNPNRKILGGIFIVYAIYRGVRIYSQYQRLKREE